MNAILKSLRELEGVHGAMIADGSGQVLAFEAIPIYDHDLLGSVSRAVVRAIESVRLLQEDWEQINTQFAEGKLLIRNLGGSAAKGLTGHTLALIADGRLNPSFATISIRVAVGKLRTQFEAGPPNLAALAATPSPAGAVDHSGIVMAPHAGGSSTGAVPRRAEVASSGLSWSGLGSSSTVASSGISVADASSSQFLTACTRALARSAGPMAKVFVKEAVRRICIDRPFSRDFAPQLISELAKGIADPAEAARFRDTASRV